MKFLFNNLAEIKKLSNSSEKPIIMLDFDGTLSSLAPTPNEAFLSQNIKKILKECSLHFPVAIISGRSLSDIKKKIGLKNLIYAGNHGLEWQIGEKINSVHETKGSRKLLKDAKQKLKKIHTTYPGVFFEDKRWSVAIHYRKLAPASITGFKKDIAKIIKLLTIDENLQVLKGKKVIELIPNFNWNKGKFALFVHQYLQNKLKLKLLPIYMGDDTTDEEAFASLKFGITIRVGRRKTSSAKYYVRNIGQVESSLQWILASA